MSLAFELPPDRTAQQALPGEIAALRHDLLRFARLQLRNAELAEDLVQDAIEAALRNRASFGERSSLKTWVFTILRNRIVDHIRQAQRAIPLSSLDPEDGGWEEQLESLFDERGAWVPAARPTAWPRPDECLQRQDFWRIFEACLEHLPASMARVFMMREFLGFEATEICERLGLSTSNCHVVLHRARMRLRTCMDKHWGDSGGWSC